MLRAPMPDSVWEAWSFEGGDLWEDFAPFAPETLHRLPSTYGAYILSLPENRPVARVAGTDVHGILDIGEATNLRQRISALYRCANTRGATGHMAGWRLGTLGLLTRIGVPSTALRLSWVTASSKQEAYAIEGTLLRLYLERFGEGPPLNYKFNWSSFFVARSASDREMDEP